MDQGMPIENQNRPGFLKRRSTLLSKQNRNVSSWLQLPTGREGWLVARRARVARRGVTLLLWTVLAVMIQALCLLFPGAAKAVFARFYWSIVTRVMGIGVRMIGALPDRLDGRPIIIVSNHTSWVDIPIIGGLVKGCFVAKADVGRWPVIGTIARLGRTVFVSRSRGAVNREAEMMRGVLRGGDNLILFPEGTSSDGTRVLPFRSSFFALAAPPLSVDGARPLIQPISVVYDRLGGLPAGRAARPIFAWYGDMDIASHFWRLAQHIGLRVTVLVHEPLDPAQFRDRKALALATWQVIADGASTLRQNRPARPLSVDPVEANVSSAGHEVPARLSGTVLA
jgi:lyso-ornithine lipid O-acyltransferase